MSLDQCNRCIYRDRLCRLQQTGRNWCPVAEMIVNGSDTCPDFEDDDDRWQDAVDETTEER